MHKAGGYIFGVLFLAAAGAAQAQSPQASGGTLRAPVAPLPYTLPGQLVPPGGNQSPPAIGTIGNVPVRVWAPVWPPNDPLADRNGAANPIPNQPDWWSTPGLPG
jgi:hypothetical protein